MLAQEWHSLPRELRGPDRSKDLPGASGECRPKAVMTCAVIRTTTAHQVRKIPAQLWLCAYTIGQLRNGAQLAHR